MSNTAISNAVNQLKQEHIRLCQELARVDQALAALGGLNGAAPARNGKVVKVAVAVAPKRKVSAAARKKMAEAARARWAARRKEAASAEKKAAK